jgi:hypothetical protein
MFAYSVVEDGLVSAYNVPRQALGAFRGRLGHLQRGGLFGARNMPGRGVALSYGPDQLHRLIFACEAFEFGFAPGVVLALVETLWERRLRKIFEDAEEAAMHAPSMADVILHMRGVRLMTDAWKNAVPNINSCELRKLPEHMGEWMRMLPDDPSGLPPRALVVNLSMRLRAFHSALAAANLAQLRAERAGNQIEGAGGKASKSARRK